LVNFKTSGTILAATKFTINKILSFIPFDRDITILELGFGDGCISESIVEKMNSKSNYIGLEINEKFYQDLKEKIKDDKAILIHDSVLNLSTRLYDNRIEKVDIIISTLPLSFFNEEELRQIFEQIVNHMAVDSIFIQALHLPHFDDLFNSYFSKIESKIELRNIPPYIIYVCRK
jgi:phospholipid N-methyltransferase